jgi:uncharacterized protein (TIGR00299 family) protein
LNVAASGEQWKETIKAAASSAAGGAGAFQVVSPAVRRVSAHSHGHTGHAGHSHGHPGHSHSHGPGDGWHTHYVDLDRLLVQSKLPDNVKIAARSIFRELALAEAGAHGTDLDQVAFHEVGTYDSICDVVMAAWCLTGRPFAEIVCSPVPAGRGFIRIDHGVHAVPPPATARLLKGMMIAPVPAAIQRENVELTTPTGAAILKHLAPRFAHEWPAGVVEASGMGAGTMQFENFPNVLRIAVIEKTTRTEAASAYVSPLAPQTFQEAAPYEAETIVELRFAVDDQTGEQTGRLIERLLAAGALDVQVLHSISKKGRPGHVFEVLSRLGEEGILADLILRESSSFGVRVTPKTRWKLSSKFETRQTPAGPVRYRIGETASGQRVKEKPEFDDRG